MQPLGTARSDFEARNVAGALSLCPEGSDSKDFLSLLEWRSGRMMIVGTFVGTRGRLDVVEHSSETTRKRRESLWHRGLKYIECYRAIASKTPVQKCILWGK